MALNERTTTRLSQLRDRFIAVNMRSRSLRLIRCTRSGALDLGRLDAADRSAYATVVAGIGRVSTTPIPLIDLKPSSEVLSSIAADVGAIARAARDTWLETGAQELAVGWPFIEGRAADGTWLRAPLLLYPVAIETTTSGLQRWTINFLGTPDINESLVHTLTRLSGVRLDLQTFLDADEDGVLTPDDETWRNMVAVLRAAELPLEATDDTLSHVATVEARTSDDRESGPRGVFCLRHHVVLGRFPRSSSAIVLDYAAILDGGWARSLGCLDDILGVDEDTPWSPNPDTPIEPTAPLPGSLDGLRRWQVLASDSSQDAVFAHLDSGSSRGLVVQGPPGTGKSQLISNLVAACISTGRRVLLVCPKRAALDVVKARLSSVGIGEAIAVVHDVQRDRAAVCDSIAATIEAAMAEELTGHVEDSQELRNHEHTLARLDARLELAQGAYRTLTESPAGIPSLIALQVKALADDGRLLPDLRGLVSDVSLADLAAATPRLESLDDPGRNSAPGLFSGSVRIMLSPQSGGSADGQSG